MFTPRLAAAVWILLLTFGCEDGEQSPASQLDLSVSMPTISDAAVDDAQLVSIDADVVTCDACVDATVIPEPSLAVEFLSPSEGTTLPLGATVILTGRITATNVAPEFVSTRVTIDGLYELPVIPDQNGYFELSLPELTPGQHEARLTARLFPDIIAEAILTFNLNCTYLETFDEALPTDTWTIYGEHATVDRGWLELTGDRQSTASAMVLTGFPIRPNALDIEFDLSTGKCPMPGLCEMDRSRSADGLAVSIWAVSPDTFPALWASRFQHFLLKPHLLVENGIERPDSFHVEFDTFSNECGPCMPNSPYEGCPSGHNDPSPNNHVELHFNGYGDPRGQFNPDTNNYCGLEESPVPFENYWAEFLDLDNNDWHHVRIQIDGIRVRVWLNATDEEDAPIIETTVPGLSFKGGLLSLSAGTGVVGSHHRIDNLQINAACDN
ncbi:MAG: hypothetical protein ACPGQS_05775 [Bradymonadia bacterium]